MGIYMNFSVYTALLVLLMSAKAEVIDTKGSRTHKTWQILGYALRSKAGRGRELGERFRDLGDGIEKLAYLEEIDSTEPQTWILATEDPYSRILEVRLVTSITSFIARIIDTP
jgi:hypothetical protein